MNEGELGRIINLIMENPTLINEIKRLGDVDKTPSEIDLTDTKGETAVSETPPEKENIPIPKRTENRRRELLSALSPYISENRKKAIESFMTIADILDLMRGK